MRATAPPADDGGEPARITLCVEERQDRQLLAGWLGERYRVETADGVPAEAADRDLLVVDLGTLGADHERLRALREQQLPAFLPALLVHGGDPGDLDPEVWEYVDDVVQVPTTKRRLGARIDNLLTRRRVDERLRRKERELEETVEELRVKERAMDAASVGISIADAAGDVPLTYVNREFERITGYDASEAVGRNCRFLQGEDTDPDTVREIRGAIDREEPWAGTLVNYTRDGRRFYNRLRVAPVRRDGETTHFVGFQQDVTRESIRRQRLAVMNRVFRHNIRNEMNVIEGYGQLVRERTDDEEVAGMAERILEAAESLLEIAEDVRTTEKAVAGTDTEDTVRVVETLRVVVNAVASEFPEAELSLAVPGATDDWLVAGEEVREAFTETVRNAVVHSESASPSAVVTVRADDVRPGTVTVTVTDDGQRIPRSDLEVLQSESESALDHSDRLGLWKTKWVCNRVGGEVEFRNNPGEGSTVRITLPYEEALTEG